VIGPDSTGVRRPLREPCGGGPPILSLYGATSTDASR
jgi:hypothetical protein